LQNGLSTLNKKPVVSSVNGAAGTGKSYVLGAVNEVYQQNGYAVYGVALQSKTADNMQQDIGVKSSTISRFLMGIENGNIRLDHKSVIILDEPTDHLDMEAISALNDGLKNFPGVIIFASRDHQVVETTANRIMEIIDGKLIDKLTTYDEYLASDEDIKKRFTYTVSEDDAGDN